MAIPHSTWPAMSLGRLGFGAAQLGNLGRETTDDEARAAVDAAWDGGIRYFDTAPHYGLGLSESRLGAALADRRRDDYILSTKVGRLIVDDPGGVRRLDDEGFVVSGTKRRHWDLSRDGIRRSIDESLTRLGLDRVDIAYLHDPDARPSQALDEALPALIELRDQGVVRAVGAGMNQSAMIADFIRELPIDVVMLAGRFTLYEQTALDDLLPLALERGTGVVAAGVYNSGLLSSAVVSDDASYDYGPAPRPIIERVREIAAICARYGTDLPTVAAQFPLRHPAISSVVIGMRTASHVRSNIERLHAAIDPGLWSALADADVIPIELATQSTTISTEEASL
ncbi:aldo/keto reductase [Microbacterium sp. E-13]|uniref:aldo/keto reductase n=1 Tax=Microbacterium sp. E-13 TaxID=3404048 RepID=UPI003CF55310